MHFVSCFKAFGAGSRAAFRGYPAPAPEVVRVVPILTARGQPIKKTGFPSKTFHRLVTLTR